MSFRDCIQGAVEQGRITQEKANEALEAYDRTLKELQDNGTTGPRAGYLASLEATKRLTKAKAAVRWQRIKEMQAAWTLSQALKTSKLKPWEVPAALLDGDDRLPMANVLTRQDRIRGQFHAMIEYGLEKYRPRRAGMKYPVQGMDNLVRESFGDITGDTSAQEIIKEFTKAAEHARLRANQAGANLPALKAWRMPQKHDRLLVRKGGREAWVTNHMEWLDWDNMTHPDGRAILPEERHEVLNSVYETLVTDGYVKIRPGSVQTENLASKLSHQRFLHYRDADSWIAANKAYGDGNAFQQMVSYLDSMARDIAMMEIFGPNPSTMKRFIEQSVQKQAADLDIAQAKTSGTTNVARAADALKAFDEMYTVMTNTNAMGEENGLGNTFAGTRNILSSALLGAATLVAVPTDLILTKHAAWFNKLPVMGHVRRYFKMLNPKSAADRRLAVRSGLIAESASSVALGQQRFVGDIYGPQVTRRTLDTVMRASLMTAHTQAARWAFGMEVMGAFHDFAGKAFADVPFKNMFERHGITAADWDMFRATPAYDHQGAKFLRPDDMLTRTDIEPALARRTADKFMDMLLYERRFAVPESSIRSRRFLTGDTKPGTFVGELSRSAAMFKNFPVTMMFAHMRRGMNLPTVGARVKYLTSFFALLTVGGAMGQQLKEIVSGRDPADMTDPVFWAKAALTGGGLGYLGDFFLSNLNRYGSGLPNMLAGPVVALLSDVRNLTIGNLAEVLEGKDTNFAKELAAFGSRFTPGSTIWYIKLLFRRLLSDWLFKEADPQGYKKLRRAEKRLLRETGQEYWWRPGQTAPDRLPDLASAVNP